MNFVKYAKLTLIAGFAVVSLMGQPFAAHAEEIIADSGDGSSAICHGVTVLAWARVDGVSPSTDSSSGTTVADDVIVDGRIITAENYDAAASNDSEWKYVTVRR
jgi:putative intracellular protease/amidase